MGFTADVWLPELGTIDKFGGAAVMTQTAQITTTSDDPEATQMVLPKGATILSVSVGVGATGVTATTNVDVGISSDTDAFVNNLSVATGTNKYIPAGAGNYEGKYSALKELSDDTTVYTQLSRADANAELFLVVQYNQKFVAPDDSPSAPGHGGFEDPGHTF